LRKIEDLIKKVKEIDKKLKTFNETKIKEIVFNVIKEEGVIFNGNDQLVSEQKYEVKMLQVKKKLLSLRNGVMIVSR